MATTEFATEAELADRTPDGLTVARKWTNPGCPLWRGYDPDTQPAHAADEEAFVAAHRSLGRLVDRCSCGGLGSWLDGSDRIDAHYPAEFMTELPHS
jgi:hypothetical protein